MSVFKIVGTVVRILEGGKELKILTKVYVRARHADEAEIMGLNMGFRDPEVSYFGNNCTSLGDNAHYAADNNLGVMPGF